MKRTLMLVVAPLVAGAAIANPAHDELIALSEPKRAAMLAKLLQASGEQQCSSVTRTFFQGRDRDGNAYWNVVCAEGPSYSIRVDNNATGSTRITDCGVLKRVGAPCFKSF